MTKTIEKLRKSISLIDILFMFLESLTLYLIVEKLGAFTEIVFIGKGSIAVSTSYFALLIFFFSTPVYSSPFLLLSGLEHYSQTAMDILKIFAVLAFEIFTLDLQAGRPFYIFALPLSLILRLMSRKALKSLFISKVRDIPVIIFGDQEFIRNYMIGYFKNVYLKPANDFLKLEQNIGEYFNSLILLHNNREYSRVHSQYTSHLVNSGLSLGYIDSYTRVKGRVGLRIVLGALVVVIKEPLYAHKEMKILKRIFDLVLCIIFLAIFFPAFFALYLLYKVRVRGPFIYKQTRIGNSGKNFQLYKIRTFSTNHEENSRTALGPNGWVAKPKDQELVAMGRWLRRWSIDEVPQLLNVIKGDMSIVGPRPRTPGEENIEGYKIRLFVRPGLTGLWQISGRNAISAAEGEELDEYYIEHWNMLMDIQICIKTVSVIRSGLGAI